MIRIILLAFILPISLHAETIRIPITQTTKSNDRVHTEQKEIKSSISFMASSWSPKNLMPTSEINTSEFSRTELPTLHLQIFNDSISILDSIYFGSGLRYTSISREGVTNYFSQKRNFTQEGSILSLNFSIKVVKQLNPLLNFSFSFGLDPTLVLIQDSPLSNGESFTSTPLIFNITSEVGAMNWKAKPILGYEMTRLSLNSVKLNGQGVFAGITLRL